MVRKFIHSFYSNFIYSTHWVFQLSQKQKKRNYEVAVHTHLSWQESVHLEFLHTSVFEPKLLEWFLYQQRFQWGRSFSLGPLRFKKNRKEMNKHCCVSLQPTCPPNVIPLRHSTVIRITLLVENNIIAVGSLVSCKLRIKLVSLRRS